MDDEWEERINARRSEWANSIQAECVKSTSDPITIFTSGWQAWAQLELYMYLKGKGFDFTMNRSVPAPGASMDLRYNSENEQAWKYVAEIKDCTEEDREVMRFFERNFEEWRRMFDKYQKAAAA